MTELKPEIIYEDNDILVLNKPSGLVVNDSETAAEGTLQSWVRERYLEKFSGGDGSDFYTRNGLVHRLDKETSGIVVFAKNKEAFENLQAQFKERGVEKEYIALVFGELSDDALEVNAPIGRNPRSRTKMAIVEGGRDSITRVEKVKVIGVGDEKMTLIRVFPRTGRTHQIRVHMAAMGHPVVGDELYAGRKRATSSREEFGHLMLHAHKISFTHPETGERVSFSANSPWQL